jgi:hypothetical protein
MTNLKNIEAEQISVKSWNLLPTATKAAKVKTYNDNGDLVEITYVVYSEKDEDFYNELEDAQSVSGGYMTDTSFVTRA